MRQAVLQKHDLDHGSLGDTRHGVELPVQKRRRVTETRKEGLPEDAHIKSLDCDTDDDSSSESELLPEDLAMTDPIDMNLVDLDGPALQSSLELLPTNDNIGLDDTDIKIAAVSSNNKAQATSSSSLRILDHVTAGEMNYPRSVFAGEQYLPPVTLVEEHTAIGEIIADLIRMNGREPTADDELYVELSEFEIYKTRGSGQEKKKWWYQWTNGHNEMTGLQQLTITKNAQLLLFDGILRVGKARRYVKGVPFEIVSVGGYDDPNMPAATVWIQSMLGASRNVWYHLGHPAAIYEKYHRPFLWIAQFSKYFVEYSSDVENVCLDSFRMGFHEWLQENYGTCPHFIKWSQQHPAKDFTNAVNSHRDFLWKETASVSPDLRKARLWKQLCLKDIAKQDNDHGRTAVTEFVHKCFEGMYFSEFLETVNFSRPSLAEAHRQRCKQIGFLDVSRTAWRQSGHEHSYTEALHIMPVRPEDVKVGDVVCLQKRGANLWTAEMWHAYVRSIRTKGRRTLLDILWVYRPSEIPAFRAAYYPHQNELFLSTDCSCDVDGEDASQVVGKIDVQWSPAKLPDRQPFVRQLYDVSDQSIRTLRTTHLLCEHMSSLPTSDQIRAKYIPGDCVLARVGSTSALEPFFIEDHSIKDEQTRMRKLSRRGRDLGDYSARRNELVWTDEYVCMPTKAIVRRCNIRFLSSSVDVPVPYDRNGEADCFFITSRLKSDGSLLPMRRPAFVKGSRYDPLATLPSAALRTLSVFSGGGNLDRGIEEGGAAKTKWVVECDSAAIHTFKANDAGPDDTHYFLGSVNDAFWRARSGSQAVTVPRIGEVEVVIGGSPCQGYSMLQMNKDGTQSKLNASMVASFAAFIDHYRPLYAILENVPSMSTRGGRHQNAFSQFVCCMVAMGYQVTYHYLEAWSFGAPQRRRRVFITIAAPGFTPISHPPLTHSTPGDYRIETLSTNQDITDFGIVRREDATPFQFISAGEAIKDLPDIGDAHVDVCVPFPDHRLSAGGAPVNRLIARVVPTYPPARPIPRRIWAVDKQGNRKKVDLQSLAGAIIAAREGWIDELPSQIVARVKVNKSKKGEPTSNAFSRVDPNDFLPTTLTKTMPADAIAGKGCLHYRQPRPLTLMEARRAQGYPDHEVILGSRAAQMKIIGNSVPRQIALALGMEMRRALLDTDPELVDRARKPLGVIRALGSGIGEVVRSLPSPRPPSPEVVISAAQGSMKPKFVLRPEQDSDETGEELALAVERPREAHEKETIEEIDRHVRHDEVLDVEQQRRMLKGVLSATGNVGVK